MSLKQSVIIGFLGKTQDRFSEYQSPATTKEKLVSRWCFPMKMAIRPKPCIG